MPCWERSDACGSRGREQEVVVAVSATQPCRSSTQAGSGPPPATVEGLRLTWPRCPELHDEPLAAVFAAAHYGSMPERSVTLMRPTTGSPDRWARLAGAVAGVLGLAVANVGAWLVGPSG